MILALKSYSKHKKHRIISTYNATLLFARTKAPYICRV